MKKRFITLGLVCLLITGCQAAHETIPEATTIAPIDSAHEETETNNEERAEDASVAAKELKAGSSKRNPSAVKMDYGTSAVYSKKDMDAAIKITIEKQEEKSIFISISILLFSSIGMISAARMHP